MIACTSPCRSTLRGRTTGPRGQGIAHWTRDPAQAMTFATAAAATECYRAVPHNRPLRPDGKPNRPLTMFSVAFW